MKEFELLKFYKIMDILILNEYKKINDIENQIYSINEVVVLFENQQNNFDTVIWNDIVFVNHQDQINKNIIEKAIDVKKNELYSRQKIISTRKRKSGKTRSFVSS